jgi:hypothetical protein
MKRKFQAFFLLLFFVMATLLTSGGGSDLEMDREMASRFAALALKCIQQEYPNKPSHVMNNAQEVLGPKSLHPAFYGCFDWHSSVHGHWMLCRLLKLFPQLPQAKTIRRTLERNLTKDNILGETAYFRQPNRKSFERTYGWAWLLKLTAELHGWDDEDGKRWRKNLEPLEQEIVKKYFDFLPKQTYPIRTGVHPNTAFGLAFALDYARTVGSDELERLLVQRSLDYFSRDEAYPAAWEPGGEDFFSPCLMEADLMRRVLTPQKFVRWFHRFLPEIKQGKPATLLQPATVTDRSDGKLVHLDGLNISRAWCMKHIAAALPKSDRARRVLLEAAARHGEDALKNVASGDYAGEHWLASFAVYLLTH